MKAKPLAFENEAARKRLTGPFYTLSRVGSQTLARIKMNRALSAYTLRGKVVDIGGGHSPDYFDYFSKEPGVQVDKIDGSIQDIDFEKDKQPYADGTVDTVILCNVLEHVYNHNFLLSETYRILKPGGQLIGYVPFWMWYHPDPHDYFRYTHEALAIMLRNAGYGRARIYSTGGGPILGCFNTIMLAVPRWFCPVLYLVFLPFHAVYSRLRPASTERVPLGYIFYCTK